MATYVVAIRREARADTMTAEAWVRQVPGVQVKGVGDPSRVVIEASSQAVTEIERRFGNKVIVEPEIRHKRLGASARKPPEAAG
jgi:dephospho-CoA kinase